MKLPSVLTHLDTGRVSSTQVTFQHSASGPHLNGAKGTGLHAVMALIAFIRLQNNYAWEGRGWHQCLAGAGLFTGGRVAVTADGWLNNRLISDLIHSDAGQVRIEHALVSQGTGQFAYLTPNAYASKHRQLFTNRFPGEDDWRY
jgi:hypothetical protein